MRECVFSLTRILPYKDRVVSVQHLMQFAYCWLKICDSCCQFIGKKSTFTNKVKWEPSFFVNFLEHVISFYMLFFRTEKTRWMDAFNPKPLSTPGVEGESIYEEWGKYFFKVTYFFSLF